MRRAAILMGLGGTLVLAGMAWLAAAQIVAPSSEARSSGKRQAPRASTLPKVDLNAAQLSELAQLPGMTSQLAREIIRNRPYRKLDDLITRKVLGKKQFAKIRELVVVGLDKP